MVNFFKQKKDWYDAPTVTTGLTKFTVACDLHIGSKYQDNPNAHLELSKLKNDGFTILDGDIFDRACAKPKDVWYLTTLMNNYIRLYGAYYIMGNHERNGGINSGPLIITTENMLRVGFAHGDLISNYTKWAKYRMKPPGASWLGLIVADLFDDLDHLKAMRPLPKQFIPNAVKYCKTYSLDYLVLGHFHCETERRYYVDGKVIIILPAHRINEVWI